MTSKTYHNIFKELLNCITRDDALTDISKKFKTWKKDEERVADCYSLLLFYNLLPESNVTKRKKSSEVAEKFKNDGNRAFIHKEDNLALYYYNRSISYAPINSKLFYLALANRSAVTLSLEDYADCIKDIDRALSGDYPAHLKYKLLERKGKSLMKIGKLSEAENVFKVALEYLPQSNVDTEKIKLLSNQIDLLLAECRSGPSHAIPTSSENFFELTHGPNPFIQCASKAVDVGYSSTMGRYLVATTDINPGDIIAVEKPYSSITLPNSYFSHCFYCQRRCHSLIPCLECTMVCYCDEICRDNSWKENHSIECNIIKPLLELNCGKMELLSVRVLVNACKKGKLLGSLASSRSELESFVELKKKGFTDDVYYSDSYKSIHNLEGNTDLRDVSYLFCRSVIASCILHTISTLTNFFDNCSSGVDFSLVQDLIDLQEAFGLPWEKIFAGGLILKYLQSMASNAHEISEMRLMPISDGSKVVSAEIGSAAYPLLSLINHSCDPNVVRHSHSGATVVLTAIQIIKKGEQIFDNYGFHHATHSKKERHSHLESQYYFTCQCLACCENWPLYGDIPDDNPSYLLQTNPKIIEKSSKMYKQILDKLTQEKYQEISRDNLMQWLTILYSHLKLLQENIKRPWQEFSGCQEVIKQCLYLLANHYIYKSCPQSLAGITDKDTGESPF